MTLKRKEVWMHVVEVDKTNAKLIYFKANGYAFVKPNVYLNREDKVLVIIKGKKLRIERYSQLKSFERRLLKLEL